MTADYPAAHSMDAAWFAVDARGHVAVFDTQEAGALPQSALRLYTSGDERPSSITFMRRVWAKHIPRRQVARHDDIRDDLSLMGAAIDVDVYLILGSPELASFLVDDEGIAERTREEEPGLVLTNARFALEDHGKFVVESPEYIGSLLYDCHYVDRRMRPFPMYCFVNKDYGRPGAYVREIVPQAPLTLEQVPEDLRGKVLRLPVQFGVSSSIDLADYLRDEECAVWGDLPLRGEDR